MAEIILEKETKVSNAPDKLAIKTRMPKNVRQIGKTGDGLAIYMEDYVKTYTKQLAENDYSIRCIAVLVGEYRTFEGRKNAFIYGAIKVELEEQTENNVFDETTWTRIYEDIKTYFPESEIVGWYYGGTGFGSEDLVTLEGIQANNFAGRDKVLLTYDVLEKENNFYLFDGVTMLLQPGYYIYYEKNEEMQNYMVDHKKVKREEEVDDFAIKEMRAILSEKKSPAEIAKDQKVVIRLVYAAGTLMLFVALIVGTTVISNNQKINDMENTVASFKNIFDKVEDSKGLTPEITQVPTKNPVSEKILTITPTPQPTKIIKPTSTPVPTENIQPTVMPTPTITPIASGTEVISIDPSQVIEYTVQPGDTLASICMKQCGSYSMLTTVKELNQIEDENVIYIGQILLLPIN